GKPCFDAVQSWRWRGRPSCRWPRRESTGADPARRAGPGSCDNVRRAGERQQRSTLEFLRRTPSIAYPPSSVDVTVSCSISFPGRGEKGPSLEGILLPNSDGSE